MQALQATLLNLPSQPLMHAVQQEGLRVRNNEIELLRMELAKSSQKISDYEAAALRQLSAFQNEILRKSERVANLEEQLLSCNEKLCSATLLTGPPSRSHTAELETENTRLRQEILSYQNAVAKLEDEKAVIAEKNCSLQQRLDTNTIEKEALLAQLDSSDMLGDYNNSSIGAPPAERESCGRYISGVEGQINIRNKTLQDELDTNIAMIQGLEARLQANDIELERLHDIEAERHVVVNYSRQDEPEYLRELDTDAIFRLNTAAQWNSDIATIFRNAPTGNEFIHVTILVAGNGLRSVTTKILVDDVATTAALIECLQKRGRDYGFFLTLPDETKRSITSRILVYQPDQAPDFIRACQQKDVRVFFGPYDTFSGFFQEYKLSYLRKQGKSKSSNKRAGGLLETQKLRQPMAMIVAPQDDEEW
jgi:hypothetical protein